jgi:hypothetical protein
MHMDQQVAYAADNDHGRNGPHYQYRHNNSPVCSLPSKERTRFHCQLFPGRFWRLPVTTCHPPLLRFQPKSLYLSGAPLPLDGAISPREAPPAASQRERGFFCKAWPIFGFAAFSRNVYLIAIDLRACWRPWKISRLNQSHHPQVRGTTQFYHEHVGLPDGPDVSNVRMQMRQ